MNCYDLILRKIEKRLWFRNFLGMFEFNMLKDKGFEVREIWIYFWLFCLLIVRFYKNYLIFLILGFLFNNR